LRIHSRQWAPRPCGSVLVGLAFGWAQTPSEQARPPAALLMAQRGSDIQLRKPSQFFQPLGLQPC
jgi:hypothetical protein